MAEEAETRNAIIGEGGENPVSDSIGIRMIHRSIPLPGLAFRELISEKSPGVTISVSKQDRQGHALKHVPGDAAQHYFAQTRMAITAHHDEVRRLLRGLIEDQAGDRHATALHRLYAGSYPVTT
jgi:hypothetical protein